VDSQVLRPHETEEFICNTNSVYQHAGEEERAERAVESAKSAVISAEKAITDPGRSKLPQRDPQEGLAAAQSKLDSAIKSLELIKRRNDLVYEFFKKTGQTKVVNDKIIMSYRGIKKKAERRTILLRWILQQIPLIELELSPAKVAENTASEENGKRKSKRNRADISNGERDSKRQRRDGESNSISHRRTRASTAKEREGLLKRSCHEPLYEGRASKQPKRNSQKPRLSPHETSNASDPTPMGEPVSVQPSTTQDSKVTAARRVKSRPICRSAPNKTRSEAKTPAKGVPDGKARVMKRGRGGGKSSNLSALDSSTRRRNTRMRKPPDRFY
jgi:hypothetical protein